LTPQLRRRAKKKPRREPGLEHGHAAEITVDSGCWCCSVAVSAPIKSPQATRQVSEDMPLRCLGPDGQSIHSFDLTEADWSALRLENRRSRQLQMPCCGAAVIMKTSPRGLAFFAHKSRGPCQSAPETEAHLALKALAAQAARRAGWTCSTEASGSSTSGERWTADVLPQKGQAKVAIEIQWSGQTNEESRYRQAPASSTRGRSGAP